jgi:uncharacterized protein (TIGR03086 family)
MNVRDLHHTALDAFTMRVDQLPAGSWDWATPCADWDVRALLNHVVGENRWIPPLLAGATVAEVGDALNGDLLGDDPVATWHASTGPALDTVRGTPLDRTVHLSFGDVPAEEYLWQLTADALIHTWDLARATGQDESLPAELVEPCARWFDGVEEAYRAAGLIGPRVEIDGADPAAALLGRFGRDPAAEVRAR